MIESVLGERNRVVEEAVSVGEEFGRVGSVAVLDPNGASRIRDHALQRRERKMDIGIFIFDNYYQ